MTRARLYRGIGMVVLTIPLAIGHTLYAWWLSMILYHASGGIRKFPDGWTQFGGAKIAWTIPLQLPGTLIQRFGQYLREDRSDWHTPNTFDQIGTLLVLAASVATAFAIVSLVFALFTRRQPVLGTYYWRLIVIALGMLWIPVREDFAEVWQYTVVH
jgi:hypothetical protein